MLLVILLRLRLPPPQPSLKQEEDTLRKINNIIKKECDIMSLTAKIETGKTALDREPPAPALRGRPAKGEFAAKTVVFLLQSYFGNQLFPSIGFYTNTIEYSINKLA